MPGSQPPYRWLTLAVCLGLTLPWLVQQGMFMDGLLYLTVAHNEAHGFGTFWEPRFSQMGFAGLSTFHEHPPLAFGMEALWYRLLGDGFWVEGVYCLLMAALTAVLLVQLWKALWPQGHVLRPLAWLPVLLWIIVPPVHWCVQNNMQENTMAVFTVGAVLFAVRAAHGGIPTFTGHVLVGLFTFTASMVKGVPGLFPIGAPFLYGLIARQGGTKRAVLGSAVAGAVVVLCYLMLLTWPEAKTSLSTYAEGRLLHRIDQDPTVDHRWRMLQHLFVAMLGPVLITLVAMWTNRRRSVETPGAGNDRKALAMLAIGLSGVLPLMLTMVQKSFYMVAALPLVSVGLACLAAPGVAVLTARGGRIGRVLLGTGQVGAVAVVLVSVLLFGRPSRDSDLLHDTALIGAVVPEQTLVGADADVWSHWNLQSYLMRRHFISLTTHGSTGWYLTEGDAPGPPEHRRIPLGTRQIHLWRGPAKGAGPVP